jgi:hypothetical protein
MEWTWTYEAVAYFMLLYYHFPEGTEENTKILTQKSRTADWELNPEPLK